MDSIEDEEIVVKKRSDLRKTIKALDHVGIRKAKYKELWKMIEGLTFTKLAQPQNDIEESTEIVEDSTTTGEVIFEKSELPEV